MRGADGIDPDNENAEFLNDAAVWPEPVWVDENAEFLNDDGASYVVATLLVIKIALRYMHSNNSHSPDSTTAINLVVVDLTARNQMAP